MEKRIFLMGSMLSVIGLAACGGGGGSSTDVTTVTPTITSVPVAAAFNSVFTTQRTYTAKLTTNSANTISITFSPGADASFSAGVPVSKTVNMTTVVTVNGVVTATSTSQIFFTLSPLSVVGFNGLKTSSTSALPATAAVGAAGPFFQTTLGNLPAPGTWMTSGVTGSPGTAWVCLNYQTGPGLNFFGAMTTTVQNFCFETDSTAITGKFSATIQSNNNSSYTVQTAQYQ